MNDGAVPLPRGVNDLSTPGMWIWVSGQDLGIWMMIQIKDLKAHLLQDFNSYHISQ